MPDGRLGIGKLDEGRVTLVDSKFVLAWPFLERNLSDFRLQLSQAWAQLGKGDIETPESLIQSIVTTAWMSRRPYWMRMCLPWALEMAVSTDFDKGPVREILGAMSESTVLAEDERDKARSAFLRLN